ncbi:DUF3857 domain-containing protein [Mucilaginibacter sp. FT3.2]|uniref:DUF3857 domain-containing protein n=1 Tax=Mucilaginibacter sp. FT3.2 TaxID=2723090 RepID=UPI0017969FEC|nr:DUF3857 domain-containing protein [Mucilaginibacter sp. FT3.2]MBB6234049.1 hypothetical protein [Mucilaginibacter sp. FT3.2]
MLSLLVSGIGAKAQENYATSLIPKELLSYASAVVRNEEVNIEVKDLDNTFYHVKKAITVLNKNGVREASIVLEDDKTNILKGVKGLIYNEFGKPIGKFSESDFEKTDYVNGFSLFEDTKIKHYTPTISEYPYTVTYEYTTKSKQSLFFDAWEPNSSTGVAVEKSTFVFSCKPDFNIRYKELNMPSKVVTGTNKDKENTYTWQLTNLKAIKSEPYSPNDNKYLSCVKIAPEKFNYLGVSGSFDNWNQMGKWVYDKLLVSRGGLPSSTADRMKQLTEGITDPKLKAKKIYEYMQDKTHYISVQVGIGGFQPFLASDVDQQNYGDCKALVNYTQALLKTVNIDSYYCLVKADAPKQSPLVDFASMDQFNHIILCLPFKNDTTFLECTSQKIPFGFLGDFTDDRLVLACTPQGGKLLHTTQYKPQNNLQQCKANFAINADGTLSGDMVTNFKGLQYDNRSFLAEEAPKEQVKMLQRIYAINNLEIDKYDFKLDKSVQPMLTETIKLNARDYGSNNNGKIDFLVNATNRKTNTPHEVRNRHYDLYINSGFIDEDEVTYTLPKDYHVDLRPANITINKPFGSFSMSTAVIGDQLIYKRKLQITDGTYSKEMYQEFVDFYQSVSETDNTNVTLVKNN